MLHSADQDRFFSFNIHFFFVEKRAKIWKTGKPTEKCTENPTETETDKIKAPKRGVKVLLPPCRRYVFRINFKQQQFFIFRRPYLQSQPTNFCVIYLQDKNTKPFLRHYLHSEFFCVNRIPEVPRSIVKQLFSFNCELLVNSHEFSST